MKKVVNPFHLRGGSGIPVGQIEEAHDHSRKHLCFFLIGPHEIFQISTPPKRTSNAYIDVYDMYISPFIYL